MKWLTTAKNTLWCGIYIVFPVCILVWLCIRFYVWRVTASTYTQFRLIFHFILTLFGHTIQSKSHIVQSHERLRLRINKRKTSPNIFARVISDRIGDALTSIFSMLMQIHSKYRNVSSSTLVRETAARGLRMCLYAMCMSVCIYIFYQPARHQSHHQMEMTDNGNSWACEGVCRQRLQQQHQITFMWFTIRLYSCNGMPLNGNSTNFWTEWYGSLNEYTRQNKTKQSNHVCNSISVTMTTHTFDVEENWTSEFDCP